MTVSEKVWKIIRNKLEKKKNRQKLCLFFLILDQVVHNKLSVAISEAVQTIFLFQEMLLEPAVTQLQK